jgi:hypothetical protein
VSTNYGLEILCFRGEKVEDFMDITFWNQIKFWNIKNKIEKKTWTKRKKIHPYTTSSFSSRLVNFHIKIKIDFENLHDLFPLFFTMASNILDMLF